MERAGLWPTLTAKAGYTFNQVESGFTQQGPTGPAREIVITPQNQVDGSLRVTAPVLDLARWRRIGVLQSRTNLERTSAAVDRLSLDEAVVQAYHDGIAASYVSRSAGSQAATAEDRLVLAQRRLDAGLAAELDVARARAEVERAKGVIADSELQVARARRTLRRLTGVAASFDDAVPYAGGPREPSPAALAALPRVQSARAEEAIARQQEDDALMALVPRIDVFAEERFTNGAGFGEAASFLAGVQLTVALDVTPFRSADERAATAAVAEAKAAQALEEAEDTADGLRDEIASLSVQLDAAEAEQTAATTAAEVAERRFRDGGGTQLDAIEAQRARFDAEVSVARARCSLGLAQALLRLAHGDDLAAAVP